MTALAMILGMLPMALRWGGLREERTAGPRRYRRTGRGDPDDAVVVPAIYSISAAPYHQRQRDDKDHANSNAWRVARSYWREESIGRQQHRDTR